MESRDDAELLSLWQQHDDRDALEQLLRLEVAELKQRLERAALPVSPTSVSDIAQEAVLRFLEAEPSLRSPAVIRSYLWTAARNLVVDRLRRSRRAVLELGRAESDSFRADRSTSGGQSGVDEADFHAALELTLNLLRPADQEILRLIYFRGHSIEAAAGALGLARDVANTRLVRARVRLAEKLKAWRELLER